MNALMIKIFNSSLCKLYYRFAHICTNYFFSLLLVMIRYSMAQVFWYSGLVKVVSMKSTIYLFKYEYKVPIINPELAAYIATATELTMPVFLFLGLFARLSAIPLIIMTGVIEFTYLNLDDHKYWAMLLGVIMLYGPGKISLDHIMVSILKNANFRKTVTFDRKID